jgi:predicted DCC family thiol-disulfide oxidoreductase YuxK
VPRVPSDPRGSLLIYDGDCAFCTRAARWAAEPWTGSPRAVPWQQLGPIGLHDAGLTQADVERAAYWIDASGRPFRGHVAIAKALMAGGRRRQLLGRALLIPPVSWMARPAYWLVARYRHRMPGATDACRLP